MRPEDVYTQPKDGKQKSDEEKAKTEEFWDRVQAKLARVARTFEEVDEKAEIIKNRRSRRNGNNRK